MKSHLNFMRIFTLLATASSPRLTIYAALPTTGPGVTALLCLWRRLFRSDLVHSNYPGRCCSDSRKAAKLWSLNRLPPCSRNTALNCTSDPRRWTRHSSEMRDITAHWHRGGTFRNARMLVMHGKSGSRVRPGSTYCCFHLYS